MERWQGCVAVVTGASSGIGACIVMDLIEAGLTVVGLARRKERVEEIRKCLPKTLQNRLHAVCCDVSDLKCVNDTFDWITQKVGGIDILVNNAGTHRTGQLLTLDVKTLQQVLQTNVMGVVHCTQRAYQSMKQRNVEGHIVIVNSVLGHKVCTPLTGTLPQLNVFPATKHALTAITEVLRQELHALGTRIKVTSISPGCVDTELVLDDVKRLTKLNTRDISKGVLYAISTPTGVQVHELTIKPLGECI